MSSHMRRRIHVKSYEEEDTCPHVLCKVTIKNSLEKCPSMRNEEEDTCQVCEIPKRTHSMYTYILYMPKYAKFPSLL